MTDVHIKVTIKVRPLIKREKDRQLPKLWRVNGCSIQHKESIGTNNDRFTFDHIFDETTNTSEMFDVIAKPIVDATLKGFNGTIFAYGQTSSGKTHTMMGDDTNPGIMVLAIREIFREIESSQNKQFVLRIGYIEIYNEKLYDLLDTSNTDLKIQEKSRGEVSVNHSEVIVSNESTIMQQLTQGNKERKVAGTSMNERSSRSHTIFRIIIESSTAADTDNDLDRVVTTSYLNLVDLAGSERADQTGATGSRLKEAGSINKSLLSLSCVIQKLSTCESDTYINYRDSKLTRILADSLGGNAMTAIICNITPAAYEETASTLNFGMSAKTIKNTPIVNEIHNEAVVMRRLEREISRLQDELKDLKLKNENFENVQKQIFERQNQILRPKRAVDQNKFRRRTWAYQTKDSNEAIAVVDPISEALIENLPLYVSTARGGPPLMSRIKPPQWNKSGKQFPATPTTPSIRQETDVEMGFLSPLTHIETPREWKSKPLVRSRLTCSPETIKQNRIDELEQQLHDLKQFAKLERHTEPQNPFEAVDEDEEVLQLRRDLKLLQQQIEQSNQDRSELLMYRAGLMSHNTTVNDSVFQRPGGGCEHDGLQERYDVLSAEREVLEELNKVLEERTQELSQEVEKLLTNAQHDLTLSRQQAVELEQAQRMAEQAKHDVQLAQNEAQQSKQTAELAQRLTAGIEYEYEQHKLNAKRRETELVGLLNDPKQPSPDSGRVMELQQSVDKLTDELAGVRAERDALTGQLEQNNERVETLRKEIEDLSAVNVELFHSVGVEKSTAKQLRDDLDEIVRKLKAKDDEKKTLDIQIKSLEDNVESMRSQLEEVNANPNDNVPNNFEEEVQSLRAKVNDLNTEIEQINERGRSEAERHDAEIVALQSKKSQEEEVKNGHQHAQKTKLIETTRNLDEAKATVERLVGEIDELNEANKLRDEEHSKLNAQITALREQSDHLQEESRVKSDELHAVSSDKESLQAQVTQLTSTIEALTNEVNSARSLLSQSTEAVTSERSTFQDQIGKLNESINRIIAERDQLSADTSKNIETLHSDVDSERCEKQRLQELIDKMQSDWSATTERQTEELEFKAIEIVGLVKCIENSSVEREEMLASIRESSSRLDVLQAEMDALRGKNEALEEERRMKQESRDHSMQTDELDQKNSQLNELIAQVERMSSEHADVVRQMECVQLQLTQRDNETHELIDHLATLRLEYFGRVGPNEDHEDGLQDSLKSQRVETKSQMLNLRNQISIIIEGHLETVKSLERERDHMIKQMETNESEHNELTRKHGESLEELRRELESAREQNDKLAVTCERTKDQLNKVMDSNTNIISNLEHTNQHSNLENNNNHDTDETGNHSKDHAEPKQSVDTDDSVRLLQKEIETLSARVAAFTRIFESLIYNCVSEPVEGDTKQESYLQAIHDQIIAEIEGLLEKNADLEKTAQANNEKNLSELGVLRGDLARTVELLRESEKLVASLENKFHETRSECEEQQKMLENSIASNLDLEERLAIASETIANLEQNKILLSEDLAQAQDNLATLRATNEEHIAQLESLERDRAHVRTELGLATERQEQLQLELVQTKQQSCATTARLEAQLIATESDLEELQKLHVTLAKEKTELYAVVENNRMVIEQTEEECNSMRSSYMMCMQSIQKLQEDNDALRDSTLRSEAELGDTNAQSEKLLAANSEQLREINELKEACMVLSRQISGETDECRVAYEEKLAAMKQERLTGEKRRAEAEESLAIANEKLERATQELLRLEEVNGRVVRMEEEREEMVKKVSEVKGEYEAVRKALIEQEKENQSLVERGSVLKGEQEMMRKAMVVQEKNMSRRIDEDAIRLQQLDELNKAMRSEIETLTESIQTARKDAQTAIEDREQQLTQLRMENAELRQEAERLMTQTESLISQQSDTKLSIQLVELQNLNQRLNSQSATLQLANEDLGKQLQQLTASYTKEQQNNNDLTQTSERLKQKLQQITVSQTKEQQNNQDLTQRSERLEQQVLQLTASHTKEQQSNHDLTQTSERLKQQLINENADHASRLLAAHKKYDELNEQFQLLQAQIAQRSDTEKKLQYHKGLSENLRKLNEKAKQDLSAQRHELETAKSEQRKLAHSFQAVSQELNELRSKMHSEQSFQEKELKISELETDLQRAKRDESFRRQQLAGENDALRSKNQNMMKELDELRGRQQKDRKTQRRSTHDESRSITSSEMLTGSVRVTVETQTMQVDEKCGCSEMNAKLKKMTGELMIKECHIARFKMMLDNSSMNKENSELKRQILETGETIQKLRLQLDESNLRIAELCSAKSDLVKKDPIGCLKCAGPPKSLVDQSLQTDHVPSPTYHGSALITESENERLQTEAAKINRKYQVAKQFCHTRLAEIENLKKQLHEAKGSSQNGECKENTPDNTSTSSDLTRLQSENKRLQRDMAALQDRLAKMSPTCNEVQSPPTLSCNCHAEEARLKSIIDDMDMEIHKNEEKSEALKKLLNARNRQIQFLEAKLANDAKT